MDMFFPDVVFVVIVFCGKLLKVLDNLKLLLAQKYRPSQSTERDFREDDGNSKRRRPFAYVSLSVRLFLRLVD